MLLMFCKLISAAKRLFSSQMATKSLPMILKRYRLKLTEADFPEPDGPPIKRLIFLILKKHVEG